MGRKIHIISLLLVWISMGSRVHSQVDTLDWSYVINQEWIRPARLDSLEDVHPRMLIDAERITLLKTKLSTTHAFIWEVIQSKAERYLGGAPSGDYGDEDSTRVDGDAIPWLALAYIMTDDVRYLNKAESWMVTLCEYPTWDGDYSLGAGHCLLGVALGYDWLHETLNPEQRVIIRDRLAYFAGRMAVDDPAASRLPTHHERYLSNHCQVEYTGLAAAGFALYGEHPEAEDWIRKAVNIFNEAYEVSGDDGSSTEGHQYFGLMTEFQMHFNKLAKEILGVNYYTTSPWLQNVGNFILYSTLPDFTAEECVMRYGDTRYHHWVSHGPTPQLFNLASEYRDSHLQWLALEMCARDIGMTDRMGWANLLWYDDTLEPAPPDSLPLYHHFEDTGWITSRSSWDQDAVMIGFKCGPFHGHAVQALYDQMTSLHCLVNGHGHPDVNHFNIYAFGEWLALDDGYSKPKLTSLHNTIEVNGYGQLGGGNSWFNRAAVFDAGASSQIIQAESRAGDLDYIIGDAEDIYLPEAGLISFKRHLIFLRPDVIIVLDELEAQQASQFAWLMHTAGNITKVGPNHYRISKGDILMEIQFLLPVEITDKNTLEALRISPVESVSSTLILAVVHPHKAVDIPVSSQLVAQDDSTLTIEIYDGSSQRIVPLRLVGTGETMGSGIWHETHGSERLGLLRNYPNPFNSATQINYSVPQCGLTRIVILNLAGQHVKTLINGIQSTGNHKVIWDGTDESGHRVSSGLYYYALEGNTGPLQTRKTVLLR